MPATAYKMMEEDNEGKRVMAGKKPDYKVLVSRETGDKTYYNEVGVGWKVKNDGISIQLHSLPIDGKCVIFPKVDKVIED